MSRRRSESSEVGAGRPKRVFVAVPLPQDMREFAKRCQDLLPHERGLRLIDPGSLHCTLAFVGEADDSMVEAARSVVAALPRDMGGDVAFERFVFLPSAGRARVVALGLDDPQGVLRRVVDEVKTGLRNAGVTTRDRRPMRPHMTVARMRTPGPVRPTADCGRRAFEIESVCLYESELRREGAVYTVLERKDLQRAYGQERAEEE